MTLRQLPILPTLVVAVAVAVMVALGVWQLGRADEKEALLAHYAAASALSTDVDWPIDEEQAEQRLYRHTRIACDEVGGVEARAGRSASGEPGWVHIAQCRLPGGVEAPVVLGWSQAPESVSFGSGEIAGVIAPGPRLVASPAVAGLAEMSRPDPADLPNNHLSYAVQWFFFALTALVIYALALRKRAKDQA